MGPNITDWPKMHPLAENLLVELAAVLHDPVTTTDELIPSGETSSYRSNPLRDRKSTRLNSSHSDRSRMPSSA